MSSSGGFVAQYNLDGSFVDAFSIPASIVAMEIDASYNTIIAGVFHGTVDFDPSTALQSRSSSVGNAYLAKFGTTNNLLWVNQFESAVGPLFITDIESDGGENVILSGGLSSSTDFDASSGSVVLTNIGWADGFVAKFTQNGSYLFAFSIGAVINSVKTDINGNIYTTGIFVNTVDFDPSGNTKNVIGTIYENSFLAKYGPTGSLHWANSLGEGRGIKIKSTTTQNILVQSLRFNVQPVEYSEIQTFDQPLAITSLSPSSGTMGTPVTIIGTNFSITPSNNLVFFNGTASTVTASTSTSISTTVPSNATTGPITVSVGGVSVNSSLNFTVIKTNQTITFPDLSAVCEGTSFTLPAYSSSGLPITYASSPPNVISISGNIATVLGPTPATITASQPGDINYNPATNVTKTLQVNPKPDATIIGDNEICPQTGSMGPYTYHVYNDDWEYLNYSWSTGSTGMTTALESTQTNGAIVNLSVVVTRPSTGCSSNGTKAVVIKRAPTPTITGTLAICPPGNTILTANTPSDFPPTQYAWKKTTSSSTLSTKQTLKVFNAGNYTLHTIYPNGCKSFDAIPVSVVESCQQSASNSGRSKTNDALNEREESDSPTLINVYPNPVKNLMTIEFTREYDEKFDITLIDIKGLRYTLTDIQRHANGLTVDTGNTPSGIYLIKIGDNHKPRKIIISH